MKTIISTILAVILISQIANGEAKRPIAAVKELSGIVKLKPSESSRQSTVAVGTLLYNGDRLTTGRAAMLALLFTDGSLLKIRELSDITLAVTPLGEGKFDSKVDLPLGELWAKVTKRDTRFEIETPSSVASVKGTEFSMKVDAEGMSALFVFEGLVEMRNELGKVTVKKNQTSSARKDEPPSIPRKMPKEERQSEGNFEVEQSSNWQLNLETEGDEFQLSAPFPVTIKALDIETGSKDFRCNTAVNISSGTAGAQFSLDGNNWSNELNTRLNSGEIGIQARGRSDGTMSISASGAGCRPGKISVSIEKSEEQKSQEAAQVSELLQALGIQGLEGLDYKGGQILIGGWTLEEILNKIANGELIISGSEVIENEDGSRSLILNVKPK